MSLGLPDSREGPPEDSAVRVHRLTALAINAVSPSELVSSHSKGDVIRLLEEMRDEKILKIIAARAEAKP
jgi:hypothetical protein